VGRLDRYLGRAFLLGAIPVLLLLGGLFSFLNLAEQIEDVGKGDFTTAAAIQVVLLTMPRQLISILPVVALLATLSGLGGLANHREIIAARAVGRSPYAVARPVLLMALLLVGAAWLVQTHGIPAWEQRAMQLRDRIARTQAGDGDHEFWTRAGHRLVRVGDVERGRVPVDVEIYELDDQHRIVRLLQAERAEILTPEQWVLHDVTELELGQRQASTIRRASMKWQSSLSQAQLETLVQPPTSLSPADLRRYIHSLEANNLNAHQLRVIYWQMMSIPFGIVVMALLGVPFILGSPRHVTIAKRIAMGGGIGLLFYLTDQIASQVSALNVLNPVLFAFAPEMVLLVAAVIGFLRVR
jgi:lipopolysaccharide export system permease protein